jgi:phage gp29-like protein
MSELKTVEIFEEILPSDKLGVYQNYANNILRTIGSDDPGRVWEWLKWNPWFAMAIYDDMEEKDSTIFSCIDARKTNVLSKPRNILPASEKFRDKKIAEFVDETLNEYFVNFDDFLYEALEAIPKGVSIGEIIFGEAPDRVYVQEVKFKPQHLFAFGETNIASFSTASMLYPQTGDLCLRSGVMIDRWPLGVALPENKFFTLSFRMKHGNRWGNPVLRRVFWQSWIKRNGIKAWLRYLEKGSGSVQAKYRGGSGKEEQAKALDAAIALVEESAVATTDGVEIVVHEMTRNVGSSHMELVDGFCNPEISRAILGQTLTSRGSDGGGSRALGEVHERKEDKILEVDAKAIMAVVDHYIITPIVRFKFGPNALIPKFKIGYEPEDDQNAKAKKYSILRKEVGVPLSLKQVRDEFSLEAPMDEEDTIGPVAGEATGIAPDETQKAEFAEKKKPIGGAIDRSEPPSNSKMGRFQKLRPSMIRFSDE